jgi:hypothetical protein
MWQPAALAVVSTGGRDMELAHRAVRHARPRLKMTPLVAHRQNGIRSGCLGPVRWAAVAQFDQVGYSLFFLCHFLLFLFYCFDFVLNYNLFCRFSNLGVILNESILLLVQYAVF